MPAPTAPSSPIPGPSPDPPTLSPGVLDFYRAMADSATDVGRRYRLALVSELVLIGVFFGVRTGGTDPTQMTFWAIAVVALCLVRPGSGLVVLAAIGPFNEGIDLSRGVGAKTVVVAAILLGIGIRWLVVPAARARPTAPVVLATALLAGTGLGLIQSAIRWGTDFALSAAGTWLSGIATMLLVFVATVWIARRGDRRPLWAALIATTAAGLISLVDFWGAGAIRDTVFGWFVVGQFSASRLTGVIRSPTSTAALVMLPVSIYLAAAVLGPWISLRVLAAALAAPLLAAAYLTYNRAVFIALYALAVVIGWRVRRRLGMALLVLGIVASAVLVPWYLSVRGQALGSTVAPGQILIASDQQRLGAWAAAGRMFLDSPVFGQGYRAYRQLSVQYGDSGLNAPHNEWLRFFAENGVFVGLLGLAFLLATARWLARAPGWLGAGLFGSFLSLCIAASFNNVFLFNQVTIPAMVMAGTGVALARRSSVPDTEGV